MVVQQIAIQVIRFAGFLARTRDGTRGCDVDEMAGQGVMLELQTDHSGWRLMASVFNENGVGGRHQGRVTLIRVTRVKGHAVHKTIRFDRMLIHCPLVPHLICGPSICLAEVTTREMVG